MDGGDSQRKNGMGVRCSVLGDAPETADRVVGGDGVGGVGGGPGRCPGRCMEVTETGGSGEL